jgi:hypothetical protein
MIYIIGLPGLYQNWLMSALDRGSSYKMPNSTNFNYRGTNIQWIFKLKDTVKFHTNDIVFNTYVERKNFVWYLYNFLEKTGEINVRIDNLFADLLVKAPGTVAFDGMLSHFVDSFNISNDCTQEQITNSLIEYFYFTLVDDNDFKKQALYTNPMYINIEYNDFGNIDSLLSKVKQYKDLDLAHFTKMYKILEETNYAYLNRQKLFLDKINSDNVTFDILETAYIGALLFWYNNEKLDWFNSSIRSDTLVNSKNLIIDMANNV